MQPQNPITQKPRSKVVKTIFVSVCAGVIFLGGFGLGSGRIVVSSNQLLRKSVQKTAPGKLDYSTVSEVYSTLQRDFDGQLDSAKLLDGLKTGLVNAAGDPYTEYLNVAATKDFNEQLNGTFSGIGAELSKDDKGNLIVISPISGFPAEKAGIRPKDLIAEIDGKSTTGLSISDAVSKIRGPVNTKVKLRIIRGGTQDLPIEITRQQITIPSVESKILDGNIGYIKLSRYSEDTVGLVAKAATEFKQKNVTGVILDVRNNPGGLLDSAVGVSSLWLDKGTAVLQEKRGDVVVRKFTATGDATLKGVPTVVLINEGSASASEITAGALRDNNAAKLFGVKSFGKGSVQQLEKLSDGGVLKVTIAKWFTPAGININKEGIKPETEIKNTEEDLKAQKDPQLEAAQTFLNK